MVLILRFDIEQFEGGFTDFVWLCSPIGLAPILSDMLRNEAVLEGFQDNDVTASKIASTASTRGSSSSVHKTTVFRPVMVMAPVQVASTFTWAVLDMMLAAR